MSNSRTFAAVFIAIFVGTALVIAAFMLNGARPAVETAQPGAQFVLASGKCAECHRQQTPGVVHEFEMSKHSTRGVNCLDCHQPATGQEKLDHRGFVIAKHLTSQNCANCHQTEYEQYLRSRHAAPAWAAVGGTKDFTPAQIARAEQYHKGAVDRPAHPLVGAEGMAAVNKGCFQCHSVGQPNTDGSIGTCTNCHARHAASVETARNPRACGQCHMGPDHSQIEIYEESKHGILFASQRQHMNLAAASGHVTVQDMPVPTCSTCHMGGLEGITVTHDTSERLSYWLFAPISDRRPNYQLAQARMQEVCLKCHTRERIDKYYQDAEAVIVSTNAKVKESQAVMQKLYDDKLLSASDPYDQPIKFAAFDLWHYYGRTAKHGAFMGGADFVQWHGYYEMLNKQAEINFEAEQLRANHGNRSSTTQPAIP